MIFAGPLFNRKEESYIQSNTLQGSLQNQANTFQWNCIDGLLENGISVKIINALPVGVFPMQYKKLFLKNRDWLYRGNLNTEIGCINLPFLKQWMRMGAFGKSFRENSEHEDILLYSTYYPLLKAVQNLPSNYRIVLIVTDLPEFYDYSDNKNKLYTFLRKRNNRKIYNCLNRIDGFVLLTEAMHSALKVNNKPYIIMEGICGDSLNTDLRRGDNRNNILYTGTLNRKFGIDVLVNAFRKIKGENYYLQICGGGDYEQDLLMAAKEDSRIQFYGYVSREKALEMQRDAKVLVNPRQNNEEYTKYSFPSKTMEYLQSGIPTIAYKLDGIPAEYDSYLNYPADNTAECLADLIVNICGESYETYLDKAKSGKIFVESEKNYIFQTKRIIQLFESLR